MSAQRDCSGSVVAMQFCYEYKGNDSNFNTTIGAFQFLSLTRSGLTFTVERKFTVNTTLLSRTCTEGPEGSVNKVCCTNATFDDFDQLEIPTTNFVFGIILLRELNVRLLAFHPSVSQYQFKLFQVVSDTPTDPGRELRVTQSTEINSSLPIFRFFIGK